ncbi:helix-turn-helix domain-containing protein [Loktanella sp. R86503]|uniref:helix-turn-helix domain-containing protein n=1 Tax=Loktanella sp. R86503 TaxID=3093847 RepID=UPI0036DBAADE
MSNQDSFGHRLGRLVRFKRGLEGLTQEQLAERAFGDATGKARISKLENGRITVPHQKTVDAIAIALAIDPSEIEGLRSHSSDKFAAPANLRVKILGNLGKTLVSLGKVHQEKEPLQQALALYQEALSQIDRQDKPIEWAHLQNERGAALHALGEMTEDKEYFFEEAEMAFRMALKAIHTQSFGSHDLQGMGVLDE